MAVKQTFDPGLTQQFTGELRRVINPDGTFNVHRRGAGLASTNPYLFLVDTSWPKFITCVLAAFLLVNILFAGIYILLGIKNLVGEDTNTGVGAFGSAFFFSVHTLTTVGYGSVYPRGLATNIVASIEAMTGLMGFALATGLLYARFSRPTAKIVFSDSILITPYQDIMSLQFRIANQRSNTLMDVEAKVLLMTVERNNGEFKRVYADLPLERTKIYFFPLTWTVVHPIDASSPLYGKSVEDLARLEAEFLVWIKAFDDTFSQNVNARFSYRHEEIIWNMRFNPAFRIDAQGDLVLDLDRISEQRAIAGK